ncbi:hypothetical protein M427DRAFT_56050 [Gonapodya prolifera JEL478]|uniref:Uncharacterized protein n=1 Tax=Gonapodya prolifera (strain JEL478) TaxID=1344416 RepID=A0A139AH69_GONPJ|nr:hypothetical protein M427DRAFT_56050 [Gonapodya prolifera JEL478]|eukprot:KXS16161.1 hypothetical protein M427DRAFT_56050 [Gonapodya prolifera JEL478]
MPNTTANRSGSTNTNPTRTPSTSTRPTHNRSISSLKCNRKHKHKRQRTHPADARHHRL